ncbi:ribosomal protein S18 acetylase RimI-like enzyme [Catenulispora sp. GAS73]|uniref:GNAT family N-acetyltransferase n=1 Tax=Catenulispora sp. GAS73 TaxID=3156269 RepID=UPI003515AA70
MTVVTRLDDIADAHPLGPRTPFIAVADGVQVAEGDLMAKSWMGDETGRLVDVRWRPGHRDAARLVLEAAIAAARPSEVLNASTNVAVHRAPAERVALLESCGFELWQEKEGFWWADEGRDLPLPEGITVRRLAEVGADRFAELIAACSTGTLDRIDADAMAAMGPAKWARAFLDSATDSTWLLAEDTASGQAVGFVSVGEFDPGVGTITYIAVAPGQRGRGHVDALLKLANHTARDLGFHAVLCDTDTLNVPMQQAFRRNGHSSEATEWHKWMHRRTV